MGLFCNGAARYVPIIIIVALLVMASANGRAEKVSDPPAGKAKKADLSAPVASVNGVEIRALDLKKAMEERIPETGHRSLSPNRLAEIRSEVLGRLIVQEVLFQEAMRLEIKVAPAEQEAELQEIRSRFPSEEKYRNALTAQGLTPDDIRKGVGRYLAIKKLTDREVRSKVQISEEEMKRYYDDHPEQFQIPPQVRLRILLVKVDPTGLTEDWEAARVKAQEFSDRAKKGEDFEEMVRRFSEDEELRPRGGDTGLLHQGRLPYAELESPALSQEVGSVSDPIRTLYGHVVFRVEEKKPAEQLTFEKLNKELLRKELQESATEKKLQDWVSGLRSKADIKLY